MEKRAVLAIVLSLVVVLVWSIFFAPAPPPPSEVSDSAPGEQPPVAPSQPAAPAVEPVNPPAGTTERPAAPPTAPAALVPVDTGVAPFTLPTHPPPPTP